MIKHKLKFKTEGAVKGLERFSETVREKVALGGVAAASKVIYEEVRHNASGAQEHPQVVTGTLYNSIYRALIHHRSDGVKKTYQIGWNKKKAPHGHLIEYGTARAPAYPFMRPAMSKMPEAAKAARVRMKELMGQLGGTFGAKDD